MSEEALPDPPSSPPAGRVLTLAFANGGGALAWAAQLALGYGLAGYACDPSGRILNHAVRGWLWSRPTLVAINLVALAVSILALAVAWREWRARPASPGRRDAEELGENWDGFLALSGTWIGAAMVAAVLFTTVAVVWTPRCNG